MRDGSQSVSGAMTQAPGLDWFFSYISWVLIPHDAGIHREMRFNKLGEMKFNVSMSTEELTTCSKSIWLGTWRGRVPRVAGDKPRTAASTCQATLSCKISRPTSTSSVPRTDLTSSTRESRTHHARRRPSSPGSQARPDPETRCCVSASSASPRRRRAPSSRPSHRASPPGKHPPSSPTLPLRTHASTAR